LQKKNSNICLFFEKVLKIRGQNYVKLTRFNEGEIFLKLYIFQKKGKNILL